MLSPSALWRRLRRAVENPRLVVREVNRAYHRRLYRDAYNVDGVDVMAEDWDTLVLLDACRYDLFERVADLPGRLERRRSRGSHTVEFLRGNFGGRDLLDTVYVTASPQYHRWREEVDARFHHVVDVWAEDGWDDEHHTVLPETTTRYALAAAERFPDKRLVVHYLQPHYPFIDADPRLNPREFGTETESPDIWRLLYTGETDVTRAEVLAAYERNLEVALPAVRDLVETLDGRTVVTADHGNALGEPAGPLPLPEWGHPAGLYAPALVDVPWLVVEGDRRREVVAEPATAAEPSTDAETVERRLADLGYVE